MYNKETYRKEQIDNIHEDQNKVTDTGVVIDVASRNQERCYDVVAEHLPVVFAAFFNIDDNDLLKPESPLSKDIALHKAIHLAVGPVGPELAHAQIVVGVIVDVL